MPRAQDFSQSVIYHIRNKVTKEVIYVGSSTSFQQRKATHKHRCTNSNHIEYNRHCYVYIRENGGFDCYEVIPVEFLKLENKTQLVIAEQAEMDKQDNLKNKQKAHRTEEGHRKYNKEYYETHKEQLKEYKGEYYEKNKEEINRRKNEPIECSICKSKTCRNNMSRHQQSAKCKSFIKIDLK